MSRVVIITGAGEKAFSVGGDIDSLAELGDVGAGAPVGAEGLDLDAEIDRHFRPADREVAGLHDQHGVAGREQVRQRRFPGAVAGGAVHVERLVGLQDTLHARMAGMLDRQEFVRHEVQHRPVHGAQHAIGDVGRSGIVEELASARFGVHVVYSGQR